ncbi:capsid accessory protein [Mycobacterium phage Patience]|nr:capsid accessory protein [Mycobacterium phage Patience]AEL97913.2 capsid accessory protein [Mycobacterium phage Patience]UOW93330.1 hypothetical protein SEA_LABELLE_4 [Mycobacterium phage Labelle]8GIU_Y Chain Y, gp_4 (capsid accessory protein) [Mycobacterium phage Patience]8GIU_Z Chain Z, gp_4 (capsid accessory protein) [Mycobacterium phage Patience]
MANRTVSPSTQGVRPAMRQMYNGRNVATRPIPLIVDTSEIRAIMAAAADARPKTSAVNFPQSGPRPAGAAVVFGTKVSGAPGNVVSNNAATFAPLTGTQNFE